MEAMEVEKIAKQAAKEAVAEVRKEDRQKKKVKIFQNTKALMENYNRMAKSVEEGVSDLSSLTEDPVEGLEDDNANIFIESIVRSKLRSQRLCQTQHSALAGSVRSLARKRSDS